MLFNSLHFLIFFPVVVAIYFAIPQRNRWSLLLFASYYFYMAWKPEYVVLILVSTAIDYWAGLQLGKPGLSSHKRKLFLLSSMVMNLGILFFYKYFNFFSTSVHTVLGQFNIFYEAQFFDLLLPVGISFYTFQSMSYTIDVYRGETQPEKHFGIFALYVSFFPQLVAGPIERSTSLLPQFRESYSFDYNRVTDGLRLMTWGFFKKVVIADTLANFVNEVYNTPVEYPGFPLILATYFFAFQIFCDFSGYSDIAIGAARIMGFKLMQNFDRPYFATSIREFWQKWHISLSTWFRDYLYIPLGGNRGSRNRWYFNLFMVFLVSGLWHGANITFVIWGALHGFYFVFSIWTKNLRVKLNNIIGLTRFPAIHNLVKGLITFHLVLFSWVFFRANSRSDLMIIFKNMLAINSSNVVSVFTEWDFTEVTLPIILILILLAVHAFQSFRNLGKWLSDRPVWFRWACYYAIVYLILVLGESNQKQFIYFQF